MTKAYKSEGPRYAHYYEPGLLKIAEHDELVMGLPNYARIAGIPEQAIYGMRLQELCGDSEREWFRSYHKLADQGVSGLCYIGNEPVEQRMAALAGAFVRNFIDARMVGVTQLIAALKQGEEPEGTVILIASFHLGKGNGGALPDWQVGLLFDFLLSRYRQSKQTVISVSNMASLIHEMGERMARHIEKHYVQVQLNS